LSSAMNATKLLCFWQLLVRKLVMEPVETLVECTAAAAGKNSSAANAVLLQQ
jgi:hypothetical protein